MRPSPKGRGSRSAASVPSHALLTTTTHQLTPDHSLRPLQSVLLLRRACFVRYFWITTYVRSGRLKRPALPRGLPSRAAVLALQGEERMPQKAALRPLAFGLFLAFCGQCFFCGHASLSQSISRPLPTSTASFPLAPREMRQHVSRAQAAIAEERYSDAVFELREVLNNAAQRRLFSRRARQRRRPGESEVAGAGAARLDAAQGPASMYELQVRRGSQGGAGSGAGRRRPARSSPKFRRRYFHTKAGYEATLLLGRYQLDQGRPLAAALTLKRVADVPTAPAQYDPELSVLLATCWIHANQPAEAKTTLLALKKRLPQARSASSIARSRLFDRDDNALDVAGRDRRRHRGRRFLLAASEWVRVSRRRKTQRGQSAAACRC